VHGAVSCNGYFALALVAKAFGSENFGLAVWHLFSIFVFGIKIYNLAVTLKLGIDMNLT